MKRFLFGLVLGVLLTLFFQAKGREILQAMRIDSEAITRSLDRVEKTVTRFKEEGERVQEKGREAGEGLKGLLGD